MLGRTKRSTCSIVPRTQGCEAWPPRLVADGERVSEGMKKEVWKGASGQRPKAEKGQKVWADQTSWTTPKGQSIKSCRMCISLRRSCVTSPVRMRPVPSLCYWRWRSSIASLDDDLEALPSNHTANATGHRNVDLSTTPCQKRPILKRPKPLPRGLVPDQGNRVRRRGYGLSKTSNRLLKRSRRGLAETVDL
jgi:hypothetical protein